MEITHGCRNESVRFHIKSHNTLPNFRPRVNVQTHDPIMEKEETIIMAALSTLSSRQLLDLNRSILSQTLHHYHRLSSLLISPSHFSLTLHYLHSLSLADKTLLIAKHLLSSFYLLTRHFNPPPLSPHSSTTIKNRELDGALLLLLLCDVQQENHDILIKAPRTKWRQLLSKHYCHTMLKHSSAIGVYYGGSLLPYMDMIMRFWKFIGAMGGCGGKDGRQLAAAPAAVVALPTVEVRGSGRECVICKEEMRQGRDVCELQCEHLFHWICILPWLKKTNTCPCCRFQLPTEDVCGEIERLWSFLIKMGGGVLNGEST